MIGLLGNEVQMMFVTFSSAVNFAKQGRVRMLGVVSPERNPALPEIPTLREQGLDMVVGSWQGLFLPRGTPQPVVNRLYQVGVEMMKDRWSSSAMGGSGHRDRHQRSPADLVAFVKGETDRYGKVIQGREYPDRVSPAAPPFNMTTIHRCSGALVAHPLITVKSVNEFVAG